MIRRIRSLIPEPVIRAYHFALAAIGALRYGFPSRHITVIGVTGTKGKSSTAEFMNSILEAAGKKTALLGTIRFKVGDKNERNLRKMTMPGRFFVQRFLRDAVRAGCTHAVIEMTSEGAKQFRQRFIDMDALIFTNLSPEHIESHGSYEKYRDAKLSIARTLSRSAKPHRYMVGNIDDHETELFFAVKGLEPIEYSLNDAIDLKVTDASSTFTLYDTKVDCPLGGVFNVYNALGAATAAHALGIAPEDIARGIAQITTIPGRLERIEEGQHFAVIVDYAHTPDSLEAIYRTFADQKTVCVLGNTGGGRDKWKRPVMGALAEKYCDKVILTDEDPYDEDPKQILDDIASGMEHVAPEIILDRRQAIRTALSYAKDMQGERAVLITGKGTDPYIMGKNGTKIPWDDRVVAREELKRLNA